MIEDLQALRLRILEIFAQCGMRVEGIKGDQDCDLRECIEESLQFISAMVEIENQLDIEVYDELLQLDSLASFHGFCQGIWEILHLQE